LIARQEAKGSEDLLPGDFAIPLILSCVSSVFSGS
jgi:hypothetical protein